jgi:hypothetical protein
MKILIQGSLDMYKLQKPLTYIHHNHFSTPISEALVSKHGFSFETSRYDGDIKLLSHLNEVWNEDYFQEINLPEQIFILNDREKFAFHFRNDIRILDMPIKFPRSNEFRCPIELKQYEAIIKKIAAHEKAINPRIDDYYCYITIDQRIIRSGETTRKANIHVDGFQGSRIEKPLPIDHSYLIYSSEPTIFYNQPFKIFPYWDKRCHNYFEGFAKQIKKESIRTYPNWEVLLINAYCLHEAPIVDRDLYRTFFRMTYTVREYDRIGNAHNPMFNYCWDMQHRDTQDYLSNPNEKVCISKMEKIHLPF